MSGKDKVKMWRVDRGQASGSTNR